MMPGVDYSAIQKSIADSTRLEDIYSDAQQLKAMTSHVPVVTKQDPEALQKAWRTMSMEKPVKGPKSVFFDPLSLQYAMGYKDRRYSLTYDTLKRIVNQLSIVAAIVNTRIAQIAAFAMPYRTTKSLGFMVKHKSPEHMTTQSERRFIQMLEAFVSSCGEPGRRNPYSRFDRDDFEAFLKKIVRDTMTYDQIGIEIVPRNNTIPFEFLAVDGSTLRLASADRFPGSGSEYSYHARNVVGGFTPYRFQGLYTGSYGLNNPRQTDPESIQYVQVVNGQIENVYTRDELAFGVRNPRTDIYIQGYGFGEIEQLITIITSLLYAEEYNKRYFCCNAGTQVTTDGGQELIEELVGKKFRIWSGHDWKPATAYATGKKPLVRTKLWNGLELETSPKHLFRVIPRESETGEDIWVEQRALKKGDVVLTGYYRSDPLLDLDSLKVGVVYKTDRCTGHDWTATPSVVKDPEFWEMIGFALGDGYWPVLGSRDAQWMKIFPHYQKDKDLFGKFLGVCNRYKINAVEDLDNKHIQRSDGENGYPVIRISHKCFMEWLTDIGFRSSSEGKRIPAVLFKLPAWIREAVLRGLFSADGHRRKHLTGYCTPSVFSADIRFRQDILRCLWSVKVAANEIGVGWSRSGTIDVQDIPAFVERIGYLQDYKNEDTSRSDQSVSRWDRVHDGLVTHLAQKIRQTPKWLDLSATDRDLVCKASRCVSSISRPRLISILGQVDLSVPESLHYCQVEVDDIDIDPIGETQMFDVEVFDDLHLFLANNMAVHNTQGSHPKGVLNFKGDNWTPDQLEAFKRQWIAQVAGTENCISGNTSLWIAQGQTTPELFLGDSQEKPAVIWTGTSWESALVYKTKQLKRLCHTTLNNGLVLSTSPDHKFDVLGIDGPEKRRQEDLQIGDYVLVNKRTPVIDSVPSYCGKELTVEMMEVLGWMTGDGYLHSKGKQNYLQLFYHHDKEVQIQQRHLGFLRDFGLPAEPRTKELSSEEVEEICERYNFHSVSSIRVSVQLYSADFVRWLVELGFQPSREGKVIPGFVFVLPEGHKAAFLRGFASADGNLAKGRHPAITITNDDLREQAKLLLLSIGIRTNRSEGKSKLTIKGQTRGRIRAKSVLRIKDRDRFLEVIGFLQDHKQPVEMKSVHELGKTNRVDPGTAIRYARLVRQANYDNQVLSRQERGNLNSVICGSDTCSLNRLLWYMGKTGVEVPAWMNNYYFEPVVDKEDTGQLVQMYDVSIDHPDHVFVGSGMVISNSWKTPITQSEGIEWINLQMSNKEMEFGRWIEYLIKIVCGVFLIDPAEINFDLHGGVQQTPLFESSQEWKLKASRDRGLKPLLRFIAKLINTHIIDKIDDHFVFEFVGLDELSEQEKHEMLKEQTASYMTLNEGRRSLDLPDLPYGDVPMNQAYLQVLQLKMQENQQAEQKEQQEQQMAAQQQQAAAQQPGQPPSGQEGAPPQGPVGAPPQGPVGASPQGVPGVNPGGPEAAAGVGAVPEPTGEPTPEEAAAVNPPPQYAANFGKSMKGSREIVITLDHWKDMKRG
jgi:intein/homing endonuclease